MDQQEPPAEPEQQPFVAATRQLAGISAAETDLQTEIAKLRSAIMRTIIELDRFTNTVAKARNAIDTMNLQGDSEEQPRRRFDDKWE